MNTYSYANGDPVNFVDRSGLAPEWVDQVLGVGPLDALQGNGLAGQAEDIVEDLVRRDGRFGEEDLAGGPADSLRHCVWMCLMQRGMGRDTAATIGDIHEEHSDNSSADHHNNCIGRDAASGDGDCLEVCLDSLPYMVTDCINNRSRCQVPPMPIPPRYW